jgi:hypothetical protein
VGRNSQSLTTPVWVGKVDEVEVAAEEAVEETEADEEDFAATQTKSPFFKPLHPFEIELLTLDEP